MSKIAAYLAEHLRGEVITNPDLRAKFSTDKSILKINPLVVAFPYNTNDIRKITHFAWQLAEKGHKLSVTVRGNGNSRVGAAIGSGIIVSVSTHLNNILEVDTRQKLVRLQPGVTIKTLQETMQTHGLSWPVKAYDIDSTVGGAVANDLYGEYGGKYGSAASWVDQLEVVLPNGDVIQTGRLSKRELNKKKGLSTSEGELYRQLDNLITDNQEVVTALSEKLGSSGYNIGAVKDKKGNFDLAPLIAGSQGTLGVITEMILKLDAYHPDTETIASPLTNLDNFETIVESIQKHVPSRFEFIDGETLRFVKKNHNVRIDELLDESDDIDAIAGLLIVEFNESAKSKAKKTARILDKAGFSVLRTEGDYEAAQDIWQIRHRIESIITHQEVDHKVATPIIEDVLLSTQDVNDFIMAARELNAKQRVTTLFSAHLDAGVVRAKALVNLKSLTDKQKLVKLTEDYYKLAISIGGSVAGAYGEGRLRVKQASEQLTVEEKDIVAQIKSIFDAHDILSPDVKVASLNSKDALSHLNEFYAESRQANTLSLL